jgi:hypothetical protein
VKRIVVFAALLVPSACQWVAGIDEKESSVASDAGSTAGDAADAPIGECAKNNDCISQHGANWICVRPERVCRPLLDEACDLVIAGARGAPVAQKQAVVASDDTLFFGFIGDMRGDGKSTGIARRQALELAVSDIHSVAQGLPGKDGRRRPIAFITCNETKDANAKPDPQAPARHLIDDLHVAAILGASDGSTTIDLFEGVAKPKRTLVFSPNALAAKLTTLADDGLFWRTTPPASPQGRALRDQIAALADVVIGSGTAAPLKLAIVAASEADAKDLAAVAREITVDGNPIGSVLERELPARPAADVVSTLVGELSTFGPHIVVATGRRDALQIATALEATSPNPAPQYLFAQGAESQDLTTTLTAFDAAGVRARVRGTRPLAAPEAASVFVPLYNAAFPAGPSSGEGAPATYDITFLLTYAALAVGDAPLAGERIAAALPRVLDPSASDVVKVGTSDIARAMDALTAGKNIDVKGLSYTASFDRAVGEPAGKIDIWCVSPANVVRSSGVTFDPAGEGTRTGTFACP